MSVLEKNRKKMNACLALRKSPVQCRDEILNPQLNWNRISEEEAFVIGTYFGLDKGTATINSEYLFSADLEKIESDKVLNRLAYACEALALTFNTSIPENDQFAHKAQDFCTKRLDSMRRNGK